MPDVQIVTILLWLSIAALVLRLLLLSLEPDDAWRKRLATLGVSIGMLFFGICFLSVVRSLYVIVMALKK